MISNLLLSDTWSILCSYDLFKPLDNMSSIRSSTQEIATMWNICYKVYGVARVLKDSRKYETNARQNYIALYVIECWRAFSASDLLDKLQSNQDHFIGDSYLQYINILI